ncbi:MAG: hypothetical protein ACLTK0_11455 [Anaerovoracaceae bacterium]
MPESTPTPVSRYQKAGKQKEGFRNLTYMGIKAGAETRQNLSQSQTEPRQNMTACAFLLSVQEGQAGRGHDKKVMLYVSRQLGHNRISVIAGHYLDK